MALSKRLSGWLAIRNQSAPATPTGECVLYSEAGVMKVKQPDGQVIPIAPGTAGDAGTFDGGNSTTNFTGQPKIDAGASI